MSEAVENAAAPAAPAAVAPATAPAAPAPAPAAAPAAAPAPAAPQPPADYTLTAPEGVSFDDTTVAEIKASLRQAGASQEQAQAAFAAYANGVKTVNERAAQAARAAAEKALRADPEFGGENYERTLADAKGVVAALGGEDLAKELEATGLGNSPALIKTLAKLAREGLSGGKFVAGGHARNAEQSLPSLLYGGK